MNNLFARQIDEFEIKMNENENNFRFYTYGIRMFADGCYFYFYKILKSGFSLSFRIANGYVDAYSITKRNLQKVFSSNVRDERLVLTKKYNSGLVKDYAYTNKDIVELKKFINEVDREIKRVLNVNLDNKKKLFSMFRQV